MVMTPFIGINSKLIDINWTLLILAFYSSFRESNQEMIFLREKTLKNVRTEKFKFMSSSMHGICPKNM